MSSSRDSYNPKFDNSSLSQRERNRLKELEELTIKLKKSDAKIKRLQKKLKSLQVRYREEENAIAIEKSATKTWKEFTSK